MGAARSRVTYVGVTVSVPSGMNRRARIGCSSVLPRPGAGAGYRWDFRPFRNRPADGGGIVVFSEPGRAPLPLYIPGSRASQQDPTAALPAGPIMGRKRSS